MTAPDFSGIDARLPQLLNGPLSEMPPSNTVLGLTEYRALRYFARFAAPNLPNQVRLRCVPLTSYGFLQTLPLASSALAIRITFPSVGVVQASFQPDGFARFAGQTKKPATRVAGFLYGALGRIRTSDRLVRSQVLYPAELRAHNL